MLREWQSHKEFNLANWKRQQIILGNKIGHFDSRLLTNGRKKERFIIRKVRPNGTIKWDHRFWKPIEDQEHLQRIIGHKLAFGTYAPDYSFLYLWGSEEAYYDDTASQESWNKDVELLTVPGMENPIQRFHICTWWYPVTGGRDF